MRKRSVPDSHRHPLTSRVDAIIAPTVCPLHDEAVSLKRSGYIDPFTDRFVFTASYLWERGECCNTGCRHCPYTAGERYQVDGTVN